MTPYGVLFLLFCEFYYLFTCEFCLFLNCRIVADNIAFAEMTEQNGELFERRNMHKFAVGNKHCIAVNETVRVNYKQQSVLWKFVDKINVFLSREGLVDNSIIRLTVLKIRCGGYNLCAENSAVS